jgi:hypothetical protein
MILEKGKPKHRLPERVEPGTTRFAIYSAGDPERNPQSFLIVVREVFEVEIMKLPKRERDLRGQPTIYALAHGSADDSILLWPIPDENLYVQFYYCPARKVI